MSGRCAGARPDSHLLLHRDFSAATGRSKRAVGVHLHLSVDDADGFHALLRRHGIEAASEPIDRPWGREFEVVDPDGYRIE